MGIDQVLDIFGQGMSLAVMLVVVLVLPGLCVGLLVAMFQAATQINEMSLSFVPKIVITFAALSVTGSWVLTTLVDYIETLYSSIPQLIG